MNQSETLASTYNMEQERIYANHGQQNKQYGKVKNFSQSETITDTIWKIERIYKPHKPHLWKANVLIFKMVMVIKQVVILVEQCFHKSWVSKVGCLTFSEKHIHLAMLLTAFLNYN